MKGPVQVLPAECATKVPTPLIEALSQGAWNELCPDGCQMQCLPDPSKEKARDLYHLAIPGVGREFRSFRDTAVNAECALLERVFFHNDSGVFCRPYQPPRAVVFDALMPFKRAFRRVATTLTPVALLDYPRSAYSGQKLRLYENALLKVMSRGSLRQDAYLGTFLKHEKLPFGHKRVVPRVIQPRTPMYNVLLGRYMRPAEHHVYRCIDQIFGRPTVYKGLNAQQQGSSIAATWGEFHDPMAIGLDASRYDQHVSVALLQWEHSIYQSLYPKDSELQVLLSWQLHNKGFLRTSGNVFKYCVNGGRCSGDMNTSLGNVLLMCAMVYSFLHKYSMVGRGRSRVALVNNGDDCVLVGERSDIIKLQAYIEPYFRDLGIVMKVEQPVGVLEEIDFCQTHPVYDGATWRMVRDPRVSLDKDALVLTRDHATRSLRYLMPVIGETGLSLTGGLPLLQEYYMALRRGGRLGKFDDRNFRASGFYRLSVGMHEKYRPVTDVARVSFARAFGIVPDVQIAYEKIYAAWRMPYGPVTIGVSEQLVGW